MTEPIKLVAIVGSLRADSAHRALLRAAQTLLPDGVELAEVPLRDVPFFNQDVEADGDPDAVAVLKAAVAAADGLVIFTPEYNRSIPAVTKNAVDWLSRVPGESVLGSAKVGIVAASPGPHEVTGVRGHLSDSVGAVTDGLFEDSLGIASVYGKIADGVLTDTDARAALRAWLAAFVTHIEKTAPA